MEIRKNGNFKGAAILRVAVVVLLTAVIEWFYFGFGNIDFSVALTMDGDALTALLEQKNFLSGSNVLLGWPDAQNLSAYTPRTYMLLWIFVKICGIFTKNVSLIYNVYHFGIPLLNVLVCYLVLRNFKIRDWLACLAALAFGFCPYVQFRLPGHMNLATIECVPLVFLMCMWCLEDPHFERMGRRWFKYRRNWYALLFAWMIANNGHVYYPFFACFILCVVALCLLLRERRLRAVTAPVMLVVQIAGWLVVGFIPTVIGVLKGYGNIASNGIERPIGASMIFMLRIWQLLLSPKGFGVPIVKRVFDKLAQLGKDMDSNFINEGYYAYMGIIAIIGFLALIVYLFVRNDPEKNGQLKERLWLLSRINVGILLLSVSSGIGVLVNVLVPSIRCYNRISPFIVFCGIFAAELCLEALLQKYAKTARSAASVILHVLIVVLFAYSLWEQQGVYSYFGAGFGEAAKQQYAADEAFVSEIEQKTGEEAMIFQLPYMRAFENGPVGNMQDYDHLRGLLHSDTLRWSYGAMNGSENDKWYKETSEYPPAELVSELYVQGFAGIWLNLDGYSPEEGAVLEAELCAAANCEEPVRCEDGHTVFIPLSQERYWYLVEDHLNGVVKEIRYVADEEIIEAILTELQGDEASIRYLQDSLRENGADGEAKTVVLPEDGTYQFHRKTPLERGELVSIETVVDESELDLADVGEHQLVGVPFTIKKNTLYQVDLVLDAQTDFSTAENMIVDFYGGPEYDSPDQEATRFVEEGKYRYTFYFDSGDVGGETRDVQVRAYVFNLDTVINLDAFRVTEVERG